MKLVACLFVIAALVAGTQAQFLFERFFGNVVPTTKKPTIRRTTRTTTTATTTTATTTTKPKTKATKPPPPKSCKNAVYKAGKCEYVGGSFKQTFTSPDCPPKTLSCIGKVLADTLTTSLKQPGESGASTTAAKGVAPVAPPIAGRNLEIGGKPATTTAPANESCTEIYHEGLLVTGGCTDANSRRRRSVPTTLIQTKRDLLFLVDSSGSVGRQNFKKIKRIVVAIVKLLCADLRIHKEYTRVSIGIFNQRITIPLQFKDFHQNANKLVNYINKNIRYDWRFSRRTCLGNALKIALQDGLSPGYGARRADYTVEQDIILITDGCANCNRRKSLAAYSEDLKKAGVHVYVIGVGFGRKTNHCRKNLQVLARGGRCFHFFYLSDWGYDLNLFIQTLEKPPGNICINVLEHPSGQCLPSAG